MTADVVIQDYSFIDSFIKSSLDSYSKQLFGKLDEKTGYYEEIKPEENYEVRQEEPSSINDVSQASESSEEELYETMFPVNSPSQQPVKDTMPDENVPIMVEEDVVHNNISTKVNPSSGSAGKFIYKQGVTAQGLQQRTLGIVEDLSATVGEFVVTSGKRSQSENSRIKGAVKNSFHLTGDAVDIRPNSKIDSFLSSKAGKDFLRERGYEAVDERNKKGGAHWHLEPIKRQYGGAVAKTKKQQYTGLNDETLDDLILPLTGQNTIRGLDSGQGVYVRDELGNETVLYGPQDTTVMTGKVFEKRVKR